MLLIGLVLAAAPVKKPADEVREPQEYEDWPQLSEDRKLPQEQQEEMFDQFTPKDEVDALNDTLDIREDKKKH